MSTWRVAIGGGGVNEGLLLLMRAQQRASLVHPCCCPWSLRQSLAPMQRNDHLPPIIIVCPTPCSLPREHHICETFPAEPMLATWNAMGLLLTVGASRASSAVETGDSWIKVAEGALSTTARELNSSKMRSRSSGLCSSAKWEMAGRGAPTTRSASFALCCSSLKQTMSVR